MSLPLDEPLHAKFMRRPYAYGLSPLFEVSPQAYSFGLVFSVVLAISYVLWSGTLGDGNFTDRYANWGDYPGFWLSLYWHPQATDLLTHHDYLNALQETTPLGLKGLYFLAAQCGIPFSLFQISFITILAVLISSFSFCVTCSILPIPLAGTIASFLSLQSLWSPQAPLVPDPQSLGYLGLLLCFSALNHRTLPAIGPVTPLPDNPESSWFQGLKRLHWPLMASIVFLALFAPPALLLVAGVLGLQVMDRLAIVPVGRKPQTVQEFLDWTQRQQKRQGKTLKQKTKEKVEWKIQVRSQRLWDLYFPSLGLIAGIGLLYSLVYFFGEPSLSRYDLLQYPEFYDPGWQSYFYETPWQSWLIGHRSGLIPPLTPPLLWSGLVLPLWLSPWGLGQLPLLRQVRSSVKILGELLLVSLVCFVLAHAFVLQLGWPQDFLWMSDRLVLTIATSIFLTAIAEDLVQSWGRSQERWWALGLGIIALVIIFKFPFIHRAQPVNALPVVPQSALYDRIQGAAEDQVLLTTLGFQTDLAPEAQAIIAALQERIPVYTLPNHLVPQQTSSYQVARQHLKELLTAQYLAPRPAFLAFLDQVTADTTLEPLWLLETSSFTPENWSRYALLQNLNPILSREISQHLTTPASPGFLQSWINQPHDPSCLLRSPPWLLVNLSDRCLPR